MSKKNKVEKMSQYLWSIFVLSKSCLMLVMYVPLNSQKMLLY
jgi:hypothetical protein